MEDFKIGDRVAIKSTQIPNFYGVIIDKTDDGQYVIDSNKGGKLTMPATAFYLIERAPEKAIIQGWVWRDGTGALWLHEKLPGCGQKPKATDVFSSLPDDALPSVTLEAGFRRVRIEIILDDETEEGTRRW